MMSRVPRTGRAQSDRSRCHETEVKHPSTAIAFPVEEDTELLRIIKRTKKGGASEPRQRLIVEGPAVFVKLNFVLVRELRNSPHHDNEPRAAGVTSRSICSMIAAATSTPDVF